MSDVNIITAEVIRNGVLAAAHEMGTTLVRTAYNPLLYDVQDFGLAIISPQGETWAEAPGMTVFCRRAASYHPVWHHALRY